MEKNKKFKFSKIIYLTAILCIAIIFSAIFIIKKGTNVYADNLNNLSRNYVANSYIFDEEVQPQNTDDNFKENNDEVIYGKTPVDVSGRSTYCMRDDYLLYTQDQASNGLCWAFSSSCALGTTMMLATGQYYDVSEAWIGLAYKMYNTTYVYGDAGNENYFNAAIQNYGIVLESDLTYENSFLISNDNYKEYFNFYKKYAQKGIVNNLVTASYSLVTNKSAIKNHIYNYGALSLGTKWYQDGTSNGIKELSDYSYKYPSRCDSTTKTGHAIAVIGWDDNIQVTYNGTTYTGAWICLNSWGNDSGSDGAFYIFYNDTDVYGTVHGYKYVDNTSDFYCQAEIKEGTGNTVKTTFAGKHTASTTADDVASKNTLQKNIYDNQDIDITYNYKLSPNTKIDSVDIYRKYEVLTYDFKTTIDEDNQTIRVQLKDGASLRYGPLKVVIKYSNDTESDELYNPIYVVSFNECTSVIVTSFSSSGDYTNNGYYRYFNTYNNTNTLITLATTKTKGTFYVHFYGATYCNSTLDRNVMNIDFSNLSEENNTYSVIVNFAAGRSYVVSVVYSQSATTNPFVDVYYDTNGGTTYNYIDKLVVNKTDGAKLITPSKEGFVFSGWYYDSSLLEPVTDNTLNYLKVSKLSSSPILYATSYYKNYLAGSSYVFLYAKWSVKSLSAVAIQSEFDTQVVNKQFTLNVNFEHELKDYVIIQSVEWYKDNALIETTTTLSLPQTISSVGCYDYYAVINASLFDEQISGTSEVFKVVVLTEFNSKPTYTNGVFMWNEVAGITSYSVTFYLNDVAINTPVDTTSNQVNLRDNITISSAGKYKVGVKAVIAVDGNNYLTQEVYSDDVVFYEVSFVTYANSVDNVYAEEDTILTGLPSSTDLTKTGYIFDKWYLDADRTTMFVPDQSPLKENIVLYANWNMQDIEIPNVENIVKDYDENVETLTVNPTHASGLTNFVYKWFYKAEGADYSELFKNENSIRITRASESGTYYCLVSLTDDDGFSVETKSNYILVDITKAPTTLNVDGVKTEYTFSGKEFTLNTGAVVERQDGTQVSDMIISYEIQEQSKRTDVNKFMYVPEDGYLTLVITSLGNDNYAGSTTSIRIDILKADSKLVIDKACQFFKYTGEFQMPEYKIENTEQTAVAMSKPVDVGENYPVTLYVAESDNYKATESVVYVTINPANIYVRANDVIGFLFLGQKELTYTIIEGQIYGDDELNITLNTNVNTNKIGNYKITLSWDNKNYDIAVIEGKYTITALPYYGGLAVLGFILWFVLKALSKRHFQYDFETNGGSIVSPIDTKDKKLLKLDTPTKDGYKFVGWYKDMELTKPFKNNFKKSKGKVLYAKWVKDDSAVTMSEELKSAQNIVDQIQEILNPKTEVKEQMVEKVEDTKPKEKTEDEKMQELINSLQTSEQTVSNEEMDKFIKKITDK